MKSKSLSFSAKLALFLVAVCGTLASCYEKEDVKEIIDPTTPTVTYTISGSVYNYVSLDGIKDASIVMTKQSNGAIVPTNPSGDGGVFYISMSGLTENDRGVYVLTVNAVGYKERKTSINIQFEKAANQTIATHMDIAMKSNDIQGAPVEIVAGTEEIQAEIQGTDSQGNPAIDEVTVPANVFAAGEVKTITVTREGKNEEAVNNAIRVYEGKPDGTTFANPITIEFTDKGSQAMKVYYEGTDGVWKLAEKNVDVTESPAGSGKYSAKINHFSRFKFSVEAGNTGYIEQTDSVGSLGSIKTNTVAYTNNSATGAKFEVTLENAEMGAKFVTPLSNVFVGLNADSKAIAIQEFKNFWFATYGSKVAYPQDGNFLKGEVYSELFVPEYTNVSAVTANQKLSTVTFVMNFANKDYTIKVVFVDSYLMEGAFTYFGHSGNAHGKDLNAGGGIVVSE